MATSTLAQRPQPFPRPGTSPAPAAPAPAPQNPGSTSQPPAPAPPVQAPPAAASAPAAPDAATVWFPVYPTAQFIASYDAGRGQRYYLYGTTAPFADLVMYYRTQLKTKGGLVFEQPQTYMFEVGRYREETMAFPPGVTVKDWTWGGSQGYPNPKRTDPARFPTIIMIVPPPPDSGAAR